MYDGMYHFAKGLQDTILAGQDFEIPSVLNNYLKAVKFTGCTGKIAFESETNLRRLIGFRIIQFRVDEDKQSF